MKFPLNFSLKAKFLALCVFSVLGAGAAGYFAVLRSEPATNLLPPFDQTSKALSKALNERYSRILTDVQSIALNPVFEGDNQRLSQVLASYADLFTDFEDLLFIDTHGAVIASSAPEGGERPSFSSDEDFERALKSKEPVISNNAAVFVKVLSSREEALGVLYVQVSNKWLEKEVKAALEQLTDIGVKTASVQVLNRVGEVVAGSPVGEETVQDAFTAVYPLSKVGWSVEVKAERNELVTVRRNPHRFFITSLLALFCVSTFLAWILGSRFTRQVWTLVGHISDMASDFQRSSENTVAEREELQKVEENLKKIEQALKTLEENTSQANLVALNASLEAARVGDAGRGFGVLAEEVRNLATRSTATIKEVYPQLSESVLESLKTIQNQSKIPNAFLLAQSEKLENVIRELNLVLNGKGNLPKKPAIPPTQGPWQGLRIIEGGKVGSEAPSKDAMGGSLKS